MSEDEKYCEQICKAQFWYSRVDELLCIEQCKDREG